MLGKGANMMGKFMIKLKVLLLLVCIRLANCKEDDLHTPERVRNHGYPVETHYVTTDDGYILQFHRIPYGKKEKKPTKGESRATFFVQHGLTGKSDHWVMHEWSLPFMLADSGFDVWIGNTRGNCYSTNHTFHDVESATFWDYSFDEMAKYDLPAMIKYAVETSNPDDNQLHYVGHSQGTMIAFAGLSQDDDLQMYIKSFFALAPIARLDYLYKPIKISARLGLGMKWLIDKTGLTRFPLPLNEISDFMKLLCEVNKHFCIHVYENLKNELTKEDLTGLQTTLKQSFPQGLVCLKNIYHYCQIMESRVFRRYDYGTFGNLLWYWSKEAPAYNLKNIVDLPVKLIYGTADMLSAEADVKWISTQVEKVTVDRIVGFNHIDFLENKDAPKRIYQRVIEQAKAIDSSQ